MMKKDLLVVKFTMFYLKPVSRWPQTRLMSKQYLIIFPFSHTKHYQAHSCKVYHIKGLVLNSVTHWSSSNRNRTLKVQNVRTNTFLANAPFLISWKHQESFAFLVLSRTRKWENWQDMSWIWWNAPLMPPLFNHLRYFSSMSRSIVVQM